MRVLSLLLILCSFTAFAQEKDSSKALRPNTLIQQNYVAAEYQHDFFDQDLDPWNTAGLEVQTISKQWTFLSKVLLAERFEESGFYAEQEVYRKMTNKDYLYFQAGYSPDEIFSSYRFSTEYFNPFGKGWENSFGFRYLQFEEDIKIYILTNSWSKYYGRFVSIIRLNAGFQNSDEINLASGSFQQRYYHNDDAYTSLYFGLGFDPNTAIFGAVPNRNLDRNTVMSIGLKSLQALSKRTFIQGQAEYQKLNFGRIERQQYTFALKVFYTL